MYKSIVTAIDVEQPRSWSRAMPVSVALARCFAARLTLCSVVPDSRAMLEAEWSPIGLREMVKVAEAKLRSIASTTDMATGIEIASGAVWRGVIEAAERASADLIVLASHRPSVRDYLLAAQASRVVRHARCSVFVVRDGDD